MPRLRAAPLCLLLAGAAAPADEAVLPEGANFFVYRDHAQPALRGAILSVDARRVVSLGQHRWTALSLAPGPHLIQLGWPRHSGQTGADMVLTLAPGRTYTLEIRGQFNIGNPYRGGDELTGSSLVPGSPAQMRACCRYRAAE